MARCGRCGLWSEYPANHHEQKYAGVCVWYQIRLMDCDVFEKRDCPDFFERIPGMHTIEHFEYKVAREQLADTYHTSQRSLRLSLIAIVVSGCVFLKDLIRDLLH